MALPFDEEWSVLGNLADVPDGEESLVAAHVSRPLSGFGGLTVGGQSAALPLDDCQIRIARTLANEEKDLGDWPRRLLHMDTLTSYEWQKGNVYGGVTAPEYNALSYTWGRWRLKEGDKPLVKALEVMNLTWPVPRVSPEKFTAEELGQVLRKICDITPQWLSGEKRRKVEFVWLDIACIGQSSRPPETEAEKMLVARADAEVGRQAVIFKGAQAVYAWLNTFSEAALQDVFDELERVSNMFNRERRPGSRLATEASLTLARDQLGKLSKEPWFSSLWTLQEAFLRPDSFVLSRHAGLINLPEGPNHVATTYHVTLTDLFDYCRKIHSEGQASILWSNMHPETPYLQPPVDVHVVNLVHNRGLAVLETGNPMAVYGVAAQRTASDDRDYIYGIQQIFGLRLGKTAIDAPFGIKYPRWALEDQLGAALVCTDPVLSQLHVFTEPVEYGKAWRVSMSSVVPTLDHMGAAVWPRREEDAPRCRLDTQVLDDLLWGWFEGRVCKFATLRAVCAKADSRPQVAAWGEALGSLTVVPDVDKELTDSPEYGGWNYNPIPAGERQRKYALWLESKFGDRLNVLLLGQNSDALPYNIGLLLVDQRQDGAGQWHRIGICSWDLSYLEIGGEAAPEKHLLSGNGTEWERLEGVFG